MREPYYEEKGIKLYLGDNNEIMKEMYEEGIRFDTIFADPPYFLSTKDGITFINGKVTVCDKGDWDQKIPFEEQMTFHKLWLNNCLLLMKDHSSIWISGTYHNIFKIGYIVQEKGLKVLNDVIWYKCNASPNITCRFLTHSHETLLWIKQNNDVPHIFNYKIAKAWSDERDILKERGKQMRDVWSIYIVPGAEKEIGSHPTQKPIDLLVRLLMISIKFSHSILDPFNGGGTSAIACRLLGVDYSGIDIDEECLELTIKKLKDVKYRRSALIDRYVSFAVSKPNRL